MPSNVLVPGSPEAVATGCGCEMAKSMRFQALAQLSGVHHVSDDCPLHGRQAWEAGARERELETEVRETIYGAASRAEAGASVPDEQGIPRAR